MHNYRRLEVWNRSRTLAADIYRTTTAFPRSEMFGLTSQMRRAAISIGANLAEGSGRASNNDFARFVSIAIGSTNELEAQTLIAADIGLLSEGSSDEICTRIEDLRRMLKSLHRTLSTRQVPV